MAMISQIVTHRLVSEAFFYSKIEKKPAIRHNALKDLTVKYVMNVALLDRLFYFEMLDFMVCSL